MNEPTYIIEITHPPFIAAEHGVTLARQFEIIRIDYEKGKSGGGDGRTEGLWIMGDAGEEVKLFMNEYTWISERP